MLLSHYCRVLRLISPLDVDAVLDYYIAQGLDRDPYWCRAWPSAICLAQQLLQRPELVKGAQHLGSPCAALRQLSYVR
jgi:hypothetical protein